MSTPNLQPQLHTPMHTPSVVPNPASSVPSPSRRRGAGPPPSGDEHARCADSRPPRVLTQPQNASRAAARKLSHRLNRGGRRGGSGIASGIASRRGRGGGAAPSLPAGGACGSSVPVRRSSRLSSGSAADAREMPPPSPRTASGGGAQGAQSALWLLEQLAIGYRYLCQYKCGEAVATFNALPERQRRTGWVLNQLGRAHFEMVQYADALKAFELAQTIEPHRLCGMEIHSTILWHLKREVGPSYRLARPPASLAHPPSPPPFPRHLLRRGAPPRLSALAW